MAGTTAYTRIIDPAPFRAIADEVGARFMFDAAHPAGLIAGGAHPSPVGVADVVTFTTHKTLRGPRGGAILCNEDQARAIGAAVFSGPAGRSAGTRLCAAKAVAFGEAMQPEFKGYVTQVLANAASLATSLSAEGFRLVAGGTENHQVILDLRSFDATLTGKTAQEVLDRAGLTCNRNQIPNDPREPISSRAACGSDQPPRPPRGWVSRRWHRSAAHSSRRVLRSREDPSATIEAVRAEVRALCERFDPYPSDKGSDLDQAMVSDSKDGT